MPDIISVFSRRWKMILLPTFLATMAALIASLLSTKLYVGTATALPVNTLLNDKARIFNNNIEALYSEIGTADELDKLEGTAKLDTIYFATVTDLNLAAHYGIDTAAGDALEKAALSLRKKANITKTGYGELKIKVWDKDNTVAATAANSLMQKINELHQRLQNENNRTVLERLKEDYAAKQHAVAEGEKAIITFDTSGSGEKIAPVDFREIADLPEQLKEYRKLINQYELALKTSPKVLLVVEHARESPWPDRPRTEQNVLLAFVASFFFSFLLALFLETRNKKS